MYKKHFFLWTVFFFFPAFLFASDLNPIVVDGVEIQAVENLQLDQGQQVNFLLGMYPFNPYYNAYAIGLDAIARIGEHISWRILKAEYFYTTNSSLSTDLANFYSVNPIQVDRLNVFFSSEFLWHIADGKFLMFSSWLKTFDFSLIFGPGMIKTKNTTSVSINMGLRLKAMAAGKFHWFFEVEDHYAVVSQTGFVVFSIGSGVTF